MWLSACSIDGLQNWHLPVPRCSIADPVRSACLRMDGTHVDVPEPEYHVPDESNISNRRIHGVADTMFVHIVARKMGDAIIKIKEFEYAVVIYSSSQHVIIKLNSVTALNCVTMKKTLQK